MFPLESLDQKISHFESMNFPNFVRGEVSSIKSRIETILSDAEREHISISRQILGDIISALEQSPLKSSEKIQEEEVYESIKKIIYSGIWGRRANNLDIAGETVDFLVPIALYSLPTVGTSIISLTHKVVFLNRHVEKCVKQIQEYFPGIDVSHHHSNYWEELGEVVQSIAMFLFLPVGVLLPLVEILLSFHYRKRLLEIKIDFYRILKEVEKSSKNI